MDGRKILRTGIRAAGMTALPLLLSCGDLGGPGQPVARTYAMGFSDFPHALTTSAIIQAWEIVEQDGDLAVLHFADGVPWQEALDGTEYPYEYVEELEFKADMLPVGHDVYLAVSPINSSRDGLAGYPDVTLIEPLPPPWDGYTFNTPEVIEAYISHCEYMIDLYDPDYFAYAIEANVLYWFAPQSWGAFVQLAEEVYTALKTSHPGLPIFATLQAETYHQSPTAQGEAIGDILPYTDLIAVSSYPFMIPLSDPDWLASDYFWDLADLAPEKPFAISETGWPAEDVEPPAIFTIEASDSTQAAYLDRLLWECDTLDAVFVVWFFSRDYDEFWETDMQYLPEAWLLRTWRDCGIYDGEGYPRRARRLWWDTLARPRW